MTDQYAVFGNPIGHSKSPLIHQAFAKQTNQPINYNAQLVAQDGFEAAADDFFATGGHGLNITVPFKQQAFEYANTLSERAKCAGAVNTLARQEDGSVLGDNTDGIGMVTDITANLGWQINAKRVLLLGAGGAVRGVLQPLLQQQPTSITIANRTVDKARQLAAEFSGLGSVSGCGFEELNGQAFDLIINGTSASISGQLPPLSKELLAPGCGCYDMMYGNEPTVFMKWATTNGAANVADGLGMLVEQAAESFALWRGVRPGTEEVINQLRGQ
ncbi:shikimate dehydrogenase [bacterium SCSIO 12696]|nr:shikimate dehydrogenase [bacterium SCSIO 12696]